MKQCIPLLVSCFCSLTPVCAQNDSAALRAYANELKKLKLSPHFANYYYEKKVNLSKASALKKAGVNLHTLEKQGSPATYKEYTLLSDAAVVGTVVSREYNNDQKAYYHTTYKIVVENRIKGDNLTDTLTIRLRSGMVGDQYVTDGEEHSLELGQKKLLFLDYIKYDNMERAQKYGYITETINISQMRKSSPFYISDGFTIKSGYLFRSDKKSDRLEKAIEKMKKINRINGEN